MSAATGSSPSPAAPIVHQPDVPDSVTDMKEFTWTAVLTGTILGLVFGASSLYLVLRIGLTVSASIPVAVLSISIFRALSVIPGIRRLTILENNIAQTAGSAGESIAFGVGVTMPAMMMLGFDIDPLRILVVALLGGLLGILMMIPLRRAFIVGLHGQLLYPEGTACAAVLRAGEKGGSAGITVLIGFVIAFVHKFVTVGLAALKETLVGGVTIINRAAQGSIEMSSELLGVGYIIGVRTASVMMAGAVLGYLVIIPMIAEFGQATLGNMAGMNEDQVAAHVKMIRNDYLLYIGAGCVATAGIISMFKTLPLIVGSIRKGMKSLGAEGSAAADRRTERDLSFGVVVLGSLVLLGLLTAFMIRDLPPVYAVVGSGLVLVFGFLFVMVSSRLTGEIGSSSNPISGMTVATLLLTCLIFLLLGRTSPVDQLFALSIAAVVGIAASNGGTTSQDLKTGFLVGGTPIRQQFAILVGASLSACLLGYMLVALNAAGTVYTTKPENLPKINLKDKLAELTETETFEGKTYRVWRATDFSKPNVWMGRYLVDAESGDVKVRVDPGIMGKIDTRDDGTKVSKSDPPKTQLMGLIIRGVLDQKINWGLVMMGAMIALMLELSGVSALAFAVGVYVPMFVSAPIFVGGLVRWWCDSRLTAKAKSAGPIDEAEAIAKTETSSGVLMASGLIAGGSIAGVVAAFMNFPIFDEFKKKFIEPIEKKMMPDLIQNAQNAVTFPDSIAWLEPHVISLTALTILAFALLALILLISGSRLPKEDSAPSPSGGSGAGGAGA